MPEDIPTPSDALQAPNKPMTREFARVALKALLHPTRIQLRDESNGSHSLFLGDCPIASYSGPDWFTIYDAVFEDKLKARLAALSSETNP